MNIAVITDDGTTISKHFGMASLYSVVTVESGKVVNKVTRPKMGHQHFASGEGQVHEHGGAHGFDADSQSKHATMADPILDCKVLIAGGMGRGAYESLKSYNIEPIITDVNTIDEAVEKYLQGKLANLREKLH